MDAQAFNRLKEQFDALKTDVRTLEEYLEKDPRFLLSMMDRDLNATERGRDARGSFTDYFIPTAVEAIRIDAKKSEVNVRINRVIALAIQGKYLSGYAAQLTEKGGPDAIRAYADESLKAK
ncbi:hypothetical protein A3I27_01375 [Candidatus Giovannonibacteria bacterium RIFCSPLOWO2_02_FULL_43_11b]|uniref:Uncharacterized protein n=1 Tax=Candidatus Giovannonibacteria bacterium RIFCSPHIGHO2_12_FULL_43_15 TaxID=1798341 RepID=A0A1F5WP77_9BACT|nr:MAG: hypothetical protein A2739_03025 [Candidatus Giovannonibacteria bacterium RIFCSPHIGHO2_01_FULL_43_100]OGF66690.1 MAG: hypothetical protein A3B97_02115 [Candidatus Giovannonibacteria bacterium RIFCSPHIGHO2_02_FULL_43_32]OGF77466.1 MAG: hypothetical protein A3F23_00610 [Candidatus Giovannonibacteria bacterium RIFCSPHIGHO2_12_FULL_43_15]OGF78837.1 MAG: hypothetical protein A3A15_00010 [Candidatus Giovannonibacteria bacterium RIFCSPLOWO2_01_FULL_43_60]OGF90262.1 MAG: hypothetical protein A3